MVRIIAFGACLALLGCGSFPIAPEPPLPSSEGQVRPQARPGAGTSAVAPPETARTAEEFDTTTREQREAAAAADTAGDALLGRTVVSLGDPARPGFWIETPLVTSATSGRVVFAGTGQSSQVDLIPIDGPPTAGSRMSLAAMRLIGVPLTGLAEVEVFSGG